MKRRVWSLALSLAGFFFALPIVGLMEAETLTENMEVRRDPLQGLQDTFATSVTGAYNFMAVFGLMIMALVCALHGMKYLHSRQEADFYGSVPVLRTTRFKAAYVNGILITAIPYVIMHFIASMIGLSTGFLTRDGLIYGVSTMAVHLLLYICTYSVIVLAAILTGHTAVSVAASGVLLFGFCIYAGLCESYASYFFMTRYGSDMEYTQLLSPVTAYLYMSSTIMSYYEDGWVITYVLTSLVAAAVSVALFFAGMALIKVRRAEAAGRAMAFEKTKPWIKVFIMIPAAMTFGVLFSSMSNKSRAIPWLIFGVLAGLILAHVVIEVIYEFDFRAYKKHIISSLAGAAITALIVSFFVLDLSSYDTSLPDQRDIESASVYINGVNDIGGYGGYLGYGFDNDTSIRGNTQDAILDEMQLKDMDSVYVLARAGAAFAGINRLKRYDFSYYGSNEYEKDFEGTDLLFITVNLRRSSGREFKRNYIVDIADKDQMAAVTKICESREYMEAEYPVIKGLRLPEKYTLEYESHEYGDVLEGLSSARKKEIVDALAEDTAGISMHTMQYEVPVCVLNIEVNRDDDVVQIDRIDYYTLGAVYPSFTKTISLLQKEGVSLNYEIDPDEVDHIEMVTYDDMTGEEDQIEELSKEEALMVIPHLVTGDYSYTNKAFCKLDYEKDYRVYSDDETCSYYYYMPEE